MSEVRIQGRTVAGLAVALVSATFALSGCSSHQGAVAAATASEVPVVVVQPTPTPTRKWEDVNTTASAQLAVRRYIEVMNAAYMSAQTDRLRALSGKDCQACGKYLSTIDGLKRDGYQVIRSKFIPSSVVAAGETQPLFRSVVVHYDFTGFVVESSDHTRKTIEAPFRDDVIRYDVRLDAGTWRVQEITGLK